MTMEKEKEKENAVVENNGEFQFYKPETKTFWEGFTMALYEPETNKILGRTPKSWGQILFFYLCFYTVLAAFFAACLQGLFYTLSERTPKYILKESLIGMNPGLGIRPISDRDEDGSLISFNGKRETDINRWTNIIDQFMTPYASNQTAKNFRTCGFTNTPRNDEVCRIKVEDFGPCGSAHSYGYRGPSPCVFIKLNKIFGWLPQYYTEPHPDMPQHLKDEINRLPLQNRSQIWVSCNGVGPTDKEFIENFEYYPKGFHSYYYPFMNKPNYLSPIIAVRIIHPKPNIILNIECRAWAQNIKYHGGTLNREGSIQFYLQREYLVTQNF